MTANILVTCLRAVGTLAVLAFGGVYLQKKGLMTPQMSKGLSELSMRLTIPCLLFSTAIQCTQDGSSQRCPRLIDQLQTGWPMLFLPMVYVGLGLIVGSLMAKIGGAGDDFRRSAIAAVAFGNSTGLPITLLAIIHGQFPKDTVLGATDPLLFLSIYLVSYPVLQWSVGSWLLQPKAQVNEVDAIKAAQPESLASQNRLISSFSLLLRPEQPINLLAPDGMRLVPRSRSFDLSRAGDMGVQIRPQVNSWSHSQEGTFASSAQHAANLRLIQESSDDSLRLPVPASISEDVPEAPPVRKREVMWTVLRRVFPPPVVAALLGLFVALIEPLRGIFVDLVHRDGDSPFEWFFDGIVKLGAAAVPINMIVLGSALAKGARKTISIRLALSVAFGKLIVMPSIGLLIISVGKSQHWICSGIDDTFFLVVSVLSATPTANNIMVMAELAGENKEGMAACIFVQYMFAPVLLTLWLTVFVTVSTSNP